MFSSLTCDEDVVEDGSGSINLGLLLRLLPSLFFRLLLSPLIGEDFGVAVTEDDADTEVASISPVRFTY